MIRASALDASAGIRHGFLTREGGVSEGIFEGLNCGYGSGDAAERVRENRNRAAARLGLDEAQVVTLHQIHSADVIEVTQSIPLDRRPRADAMVSRTPGLALGILTADCVPVLFADADAGVVGAAHAGWKGALSGIVASTVAAMERIGARREHIAAAVGPCIRQPSYEVGPELLDAFTRRDEGDAKFFVPSARDGRFMFDLAGFVVARARAEGLAEVEDVARDTYAEERLFFSYRRATHRAEPDYGRGLSLIALDPGAGGN
jgi:YfiH family protein